MPEELTLEDGVSAAKAILKLATANLVREDRVSDLPYPGIGLPPGRPPVTLAYVGSAFVFKLIKLFGNLKKRRLLIEGPRGIGKSSDLRALACVLYSDFALNKTKDVLVSIWNLNAAVACEVQVVKDALLFAYLVKWEGQLVLGPPEPAEGYENEESETDADDEMDLGLDLDKRKQSAEEIQQAVEMERNSVMVKIHKIVSMQDAADFVEERKREQGEKFHFFADGWEEFDSDKTDRSRLREKVKTRMERLFMHGTTVTIALSANSTLLDMTTRDTHVITKAHPLSKVQYDSYKNLNILGQLDQIRAKDIAYYTGHVPWLLEILLDCCDAYGKQAADDARLAKGMSKGGRINVAAASALPLTYPKGDELAELFRNDDAWASVLNLFRGELSGVRKAIDKIELRPAEQLRSMGAMGAKDKTYFIVAEDRYCSQFIERIYVEAFRAKEEAAGQSSRGGQHGA